MKFISDSWCNFPWVTRETVWFDGIEWRKTTARRYYKGNEWYMETTTLTLLEACRWLKFNRKGGYKSKAA